MAASTEAWLLSLNERIHEVEGEGEEALQKRRQLVRFLVEKITTGRDENGQMRVQITYRFAPPSESVVTGIQETSRSSAENGYGSSGSRTISGCAASTSSSVKTG